MTYLYILYILTQTICTIVTNKYVVITKSGSPEIQFSMNENIFSLQFVKKKVYKSSEGNILKILKYKDGYRLKFFNSSLYNDPKAHEFTGAKFDSKDKGFLFNIFPVQNGVKIVKNDKCLEKMGWNEQRYGFYVGLFPCVNSINQVFTIRPVLIESHDENLKINLNIIPDE